MKKLVLVFAGIIIVVILLVVLDYLDKEHPVKVKVSMEGSFFKDAQFIQKKDGQLKLQLFSKEALMSDDGKLMDLRELTMFFPEKNLTVKARKGFYWIESGDLILSEWIEGFSKEYKIYGTEAYWSAKDKTLYSDNPLKIEGNRFIIEGNSGKASENLIELKKGVTAIVYSKK
ncbi:LPS export ABC transporter periplasmic protein LptC [Thermodesulfovibrio sp. 3907-1M]|uniref:LPS export ABC transporter periplasmic protein LptC n=1 Tax=Thermodesulfovibrio autotrophicus TaxID=3118333 RepID=A0AAU8GU08_9BACT